jgi:hypothetical protein
MLLQVTGSRSKRITLQPAKYGVKDEDNNLKNEDVIMCCLDRAIAHRMRRSYEYGAKVES